MRSTRASTLKRLTILLGALLRHPVALNESVYLKAVNFTFTCTYFNFRSAATVAAARYWRLEPETTKRHSHRCRRSRPAPCARTMKQHRSRCSHSALAHRAHTPKRRSHRCSRSKLPWYLLTPKPCSNAAPAAAARHSHFLSLPALGRRCRHHQPRRSTLAPCARTTQRRSSR